MKLKRCPHCAGIATLWKEYNYPDGNWLVDVRCLICGSRTRAFESEDDPNDVDWGNMACEAAVDVWNLRIPHSAI